MCTKRLKEEISQNKNEIINFIVIGILSIGAFLNTPSEELILQVAYNGHIIAAITLLLIKTLLTIQK